MRHGPVDPEFVISGKFDDKKYIERRCTSVPLAVRGSLNSVLQYLYLTDGPRNLSVERKRAAEPYLHTAERMVVRWLFPRTNGAYRKTYGFPALNCARRARYTCEWCGIKDVRVLEFDHVHGRRNLNRFACLCANCHRIKSRTADWNGRPRT
jgi:hypothetical protein